jgi:hypothetical protein
MTTYYHRQHSDGEIVNASESDLSLPEISKRWPLAFGYYDPNPPLEVLKRYRYWDERP